MTSAFLQNRVVANVRNVGGAEENEEKTAEKTAEGGIHRNVRLNR